MISPKTFLTFSGLFGLILAIPALAGTPLGGSPISAPSKMAMPSTSMPTGGGSPSMPGSSMSPAADPTAMPSTLSGPTGGGTASPTTDPTTTPTGTASPTTDPTATPTGTASPTTDPTATPTGGASPSPTMTPSPTSTTSPKPSGKKKSGKSSTTTVDINTASSADLQKVKGIGAPTAKKIITGRPYNSLEDLVTKKVLTPTQFKTLKPNLRF
jgi:DNA uptake protein ComE-like DNA-binding protein